MSGRRATKKVSKRKSTKRKSTKRKSTKRKGSKKQVKVKLANVPMQEKPYDPLGMLDPGLQTIKYMKDEGLLEPQSHEPLLGLGNPLINTPLVPGVMSGQMIFTPTQPNYSEFSGKIIACYDEETLNKLLTPTMPTMEETLNKLSTPTMEGGSMIPGLPLGMGMGLPFGMGIGKADPEIAKQLLNYQLMQKQMPIWFLIYYT